MTEPNDERKDNEQETIEPPQTPDTPDAQEALPPAPASLLGVFRPARLQRELAIDTVLRRMIAVAVLALLWWGVAGSARGSLLPWIGVGLAAAAWVMLGHGNARVLRAVTEMPGLIEFRPDGAELVLQRMLKRKAMPRWLRLMLYHRWAMIRHRQQRYSEAAAIAQSVLHQPTVGPAKKLRGHLLLMLVEARLEEREAWGAYYALVELGRVKLNLPETLQRMALRTRYELMIGRDHEVLRDARDKVRLSELMPGPQCGAFHAMLAIAAENTGHDEWHRWLWRRVTLLCNDEQIAQLREAVGAPDPSQAAAEQ